MKENQQTELSVELEKVEIATRLFHSCTLQQLQDIEVCYIPEKSIKAKSEKARESH